MITYAETYEIVTPESAEYGDADERGFIDERLTSDFRDMVDLLEGTEPSCNPLPADPGRHVWYTHYQYDVDYSTAGEESRSYHPLTDRDGRYMAKAWRHANRNRG